MISKTFNNPLGLSRFVILYRILAEDPSGEIHTYDQDIFVGLPGHQIAHYVDIVTTLSGIAINNILNQAQTQAETDAYALFTGARSRILAIPGWATWTETQTLAWGETNIGTPLANARTSLPTTLTLATARAAFVVLLGILDQMWIMQKSMARMLLALRDETWPGLSE
jgi:hypothetical protein